MLGPTLAAGQSLPAEIETPSDNQIERNIIFFYDKSTFQANDDQPTQWGNAVRKSGMLWPKSWGAGIMVSDSVDEKNGYLCLTDKEFKSACDRNIVFKKEAREYLEHGENKESYWTAAIFLKQIEHLITQLLK